jgi:hypothetical protein
MNPDAFLGGEDKSAPIHHTEAPTGPVARLLEHYSATGTYRPEDLMRVLGLPNDAVIVSPGKSVSQHLTR